MRLKLLTLLSVILSATAAYGTTQSPDILLLDGKTHKLNSNPLEAYFEAHPTQHPVHADDGDEIEIGSSLWRGYIATFEIMNNDLIIQDFEVYRRPKDRKERSRLLSEIDRFFPTSESRKMHWYSGILVLPIGEVRRRVNLSYATVYDSYVLLRVIDGRLTERSEMTSEEFARFKRRQFDVYRHTDEYLELVNELRDTSDEQSEVEQFIFEYGRFVEHILIDFDAATPLGRKD